MLQDNLQSVRLTGFDLCDACGFRAYSVAERSDVASELMFCVHHCKKHRQRLEDEGWTIIDDCIALEELLPDHQKAVVV